MKIKIACLITTLAIAMLAITTPSVFVYANAAESDAPEPGDCPDPTDPLCPPATTTNQTGNTTAASTSSTAK